MFLSFLFFFSYLDKILQSNIKDEKHDHHVDNYFKSSLNSTDNIDQPLLIVLDEDDVNSSEENDQCNILTHKLKNEEQKIDIPNQDLSTGRRLFLIINENKKVFFLFSI